jgi:hypothetical protein
VRGDPRWRDAILSLLRSYYWSTPVFFVLDRFFGLNVRVSDFIGSPGWRLVYYLFCVGCLFILLKRPHWGPFAGLFESSVNLFTLMSGILFPIWNAEAAGPAAVALEPPVTPERVVHFLLAGTMCLVSFYGCLSVLQTNRFRPEIELDK